ncbi:polygalacturonase At1g48100-like isoform X3 [Arachis stenosperma]|uniref:polygalacturonase At1g48100-like isoform X3 n=1 Tax=Arachis stenosperma TaxID=217475 RepID=UPI0025AC5966|nr:polygalacturonase At1g48100-like isoform X3 [Arachis stenosperma]
MKWVVNQFTFALIIIATIVFSAFSSSCSDEHSSAAPNNSDPTTFNVLDYGAKGDGHADDTKAFEDAWEAACKIDSSTMVVPSGKVFLIKPISFAGPNCRQNIVFQVLPSSGKLPSTKPTALRFYGSDGVTVTGITIQNSQQMHLKFDSCTNVQVFDIKISSPGDSPNTDGIHLQESQNVVLHSSTFACGDDCVSIQTGCSNIFIHDLNCGPSHGISIGGLGKDNTKAFVSNITVQNINIQNSLTAVRIKSWQGGSGSCKNVMFSNIQVSDAETPIIIDQYYCDNSKCKNSTSAVAVSAINYVNIKGTYTKEPVRFACSDSVPCSGLTLDNISLEPSKGVKDSAPFCWKASGKLNTKTVPPITCLQQSSNTFKLGIHMLTSKGFNFLRELL